MKIAAIKASRLPEKVFIIFDDKKLLPLPVEDISRLNLSKGLEVTPEKYLEMAQSSLLFALYNYSLRQIGLSPKITAVLRGKLMSYYPRKLFQYHLTDITLDRNTIIEAVLSKLQSQNLLNESEFVRFFIRRHLNRSRRQLQYELQHYGVDPSLIDSSLNSDLPSSTVQIQKILTKKKVTQSLLADYKQKSKIMASLARKGYTFEEITFAIDDFLQKK